MRQFGLSITTFHATGSEHYNAIYFLLPSCSEDNNNSTWLDLLRSPLSPLLGLRHGCGLCTAYALLVAHLDIAETLGLSQ
jgi:hypothetical protein